VPLSVPGLSWSNLDGYYQMIKQLIYLMVLCGKSLTPIQGANKYWHAATRNSSTSLHNSYKYAWEASSTWTNGSVWNIPNTLAIDGSTYDWNIVKQITM
jgi:hypothetical protein